MPCTPCMYYIEMPYALLCSEKVMQFANGTKWCPKFQDLKISLRSRDFYGISIFHRDFKMSYRFQDFNEISQDLTKILQDFSENLTDIIIYGNKRRNRHKDLGSWISSKISTCILASASKISACCGPLGSLMFFLSFPEKKLHLLATLPILSKLDSIIVTGRSAKSRNFQNFH